MRYRNVSTGAVVTVRDDKVLGSEWEPQAEPAQAKAAAKKAPSKSSDK